MHEYNNIEFKAMMMMFCFVFIRAVPGVTGSQLNVRHSGLSLCNTVGKNVGLWVNEMRIILKFRCFSSEMM